MTCRNVSSHGRLTYFLKPFVTNWPPSTLKAVDKFPAISKKLTTTG